jgi:hypothetical protein
MMPIASTPEIRIRQFSSSAFSIGQTSSNMYLKDSKPVRHICVTAEKYLIETYDYLMLHNHVIGNEHRFRAFY